MAITPPSLDFLSPDFDALEALRTEGLLPPNPRVRPLDNLHKCRRILPTELPESLANVPVREPRSQESIAAQQRAKARTSLLLEKAAERARQAKILDTIADKLKQGPLGLLVNCYEQKSRVQVWTRHTHGIRGTMVGFVRALDKHFNMVNSWVVQCNVNKYHQGKLHRKVLNDVDEQYTVLRRVPRLVRKRGRVHIPQQEGNETDNLLVEDVRDGLGNENKLPAPTTVEGLIESMKELKLFPKLEHRQRHLNQVFVRGDNVVMVRKLS